MFRPLSLSLGLRYIRAKRKNQFISFISLVSIIGIALGVAVLVIVLSVMNGFDSEIKTRILSMVPHLTVTNYNHRVSNWQELSTKIKQNPKVKHIAPYIESEAMLQNHGMVTFGVVQGIDPKLQEKISPIAKNMVLGKLEDLNKNRFGIILGDELANQLGVAINDKVTVIVPKYSMGPVGLVPHLKQFTVIGMFHSGYQYDSSYAYISLKDAQVLNSMKGDVTGIEIKSTDLYLAPELGKELMQQIPGVFASDWTMQNAAFFKALKMEKIMMMLILVLIIAVAAFNMLSSLVMLVVDKSSDIAILMTIGMRRKTIMRIFMIQGMMIGIIGAMVGLIIGVIVSYNVTAIVSQVQKILGVQFLNSNVYYINYVPSKIEAMDLITVAALAFILSFLATVYPAWRASRIKPVEALRYE